jgi:hypothetical protein
MRGCATSVKHKEIPVESFHPGLRSASCSRDRLGSSYVFAFRFFHLQQSIGPRPFAVNGETLAKIVHSIVASAMTPKEYELMVDLNRIKIMPRDDEVLRLLAQGSSNQEIAGQLNISV